MWHKPKKQEILPRIKELATIIQKKACCYGTIHGDGRPCDCKYLQKDDRMYVGSAGENTGCCEAREILELLELFTGKDRKPNVLYANMFTSEGLYSREPVPFVRLKGTKRWVHKDISIEGWEGEWFHEPDGKMLVSRDYNEVKCWTEGIKVVQDKLQKLTEVKSDVRIEKWEFTRRSGEVHPSPVQLRNKQRKRSV